MWLISIIATLVLVLVVLFYFSVKTTPNGIERSETNLQIKVSCLILALIEDVRKLWMTEWKRTDDGAEDGKADVEFDRTYRLERGQAGIFQDHAIHSIAYPGGARFIRVTGVDLQTIARGRYDVEAGTMVVEKRPNFKGAT